MHRGGRLAGAALRGDLAHLDAGVGEEQAEELAARVARGADDRHRDRAHAGTRARASAKSTILAGMSTPVGAIEFLYSIV